MLGLPQQIHRQCMRHRRLARQHGFNLIAWARTVQHGHSRIELRFGQHPVARRHSGQDALDFRVGEVCRAGAKGVKEADARAIVVIVGWPNMRLDGAVFLLGLEAGARRLAPGGRSLGSLDNGCLLALTRRLLLLNNRQPTRFALARQALLLW
jgi:hypothetical protein